MTKEQELLVNILVIAKDIGTDAGIFSEYVLDGNESVFNKYGTVLADLVKDQFNLPPDNNGFPEDWNDRETEYHDLWNKNSFSLEESFSDEIEDCKAVEDFITFVNKWSDKQFKKDCWDKYKKSIEVLGELL
jgi:hypothetical protein